MIVGLSTLEPWQQRATADLYADLHTELELTLGRHRNPPGGEARIDERLEREVDHDAPRQTVGVFEAKPGGLKAAPTSTVVLDARLLDGEHVGEVDLDEQLEGDLDRLAAVVANQDPLAHSVAHVPVSGHDEIGVGLSTTRMDAPHEGGLEGSLVVHGQRLERRAIDVENPSREDPRVKNEQSLGQLGMDVPRAVGQAER
jgi:hypothetical protein